MDCKDEELSSLHHKFLDNLWEVFNTVCRNLNELRYLVGYVIDIRTMYTGLETTGESSTFS